MGLRFSFFNTPEHRVFNYQPRYYDPHKERLEELYAKYGKTPEGKKIVEEIAREEGIRSESQYIPGQSIRGAFRRSVEQSRAQAGNPRLKTILGLVTVGIAFIVVYFLAEGFMKMLK